MARVREALVAARVSALVRLFARVRALVHFEIARVREALVAARVSALVRLFARVRALVHFEMARGREALVAARVRARVPVLTHCLPLRGHDLRADARPLVALPPSLFIECLLFGTVRVSGPPRPLLRNQRLLALICPRVRLAARQICRGHHR